MDPMMMLALMIETVDKMARLNEPLSLTLQDINGAIARNGKVTPADEHFKSLIETLAEFTSQAKIARESIEAANSTLQSEKGMGNILRPNFS